MVAGGLSGAEVVEYTTATVEKRGGDVKKTIEQGRWIMENWSSGLPYVFELTENGYVMEKLEAVRYSDVKAHDVVRLLRKYVWSLPAKTPATSNTFRLLRDKVLGNIAKDEVKSSLDIEGQMLPILEATLVAYSAAKSFPASLSHGDPTAENVMYRRGYGHVLIDPIKATEAIPDSPCVDVGKMLQSAYGWEAAKYGVDERAYSADDVRKAVNDDKLFRGGQAWAVIHVVRALPYVQQHAPKSIDRVVSVLTTALKEGGFLREVVL